MKNFLLSSLLLAFAGFALGAENDGVETDLIGDGEEEVAGVVVEGVLIERPDGRFIEFLLVENKMVFNFFTEAMLPEAPDVDRIAIRMKRTQPRTRTLYFSAIPTEGLPGLRAPQYVQNPLIFWAYIALINDGNDEPVEFYIVQYPQALTSPEPITVNSTEATEDDG
jgi:hypothetical protein